MNKLIKEIMFALALTLASLHGLATADAHEIKFGSLVIGHPWSRQSPMAAEVAAGFLKITNTGTEDDTLVKATAEIAPVVQLHEMKMDGDIMTMAEVKGGIVIPAGQTVELKPMGLHIMFLQVKEQPVVNTSFKGSLTFEKAGTVEVEFEVVEPKATMEHMQ